MAKPQFTKTVVINAFLVFSEWILKLNFESTNFKFLITKARQKLKPICTIFSKLLTEEYIILNTKR